MAAVPADGPQLPSCSLECQLLGSRGPGGHSNCMLYVHGIFHPLPNGSLCGSFQHLPVHEAALLSLGRHVTISDEPCGSWNQRGLSLWPTRNGSAPSSAPLVPVSTGSSLFLSTPVTVLQGDLMM